MKKLYLVEVECDSMLSSFLVVEESEDDAKQKVEKMFSYDYIQALNIKEINKVEGYVINLG